MFFLRWLGIVFDLNWNLELDVFTIDVRSKIDWIINIFKNSSYVWRVVADDRSFWDPLALEIIGNFKINVQCLTLRSCLRSKWSDKSMNCFSLFFLLVTFWSFFLFELFVLASSSFPFHKVNNWFIARKSLIFVSFFFILFWLWIEASFLSSLFSFVFLILNFVFHPRW